jgi:hypothetical protein
VSGLKERLITSDAGAEFMSQIYRLLKVAKDDVDSMVQFHAEVALADLSVFMRDQLFPPV